MRKREKQTGTEEYGKFMYRLLRSYSRKALEGQLDVEALRQLAEIQVQLDEQTAQTVAALRSEAGGRHSWTEIGRALGISRSQAKRRYGHLDDETVRRVGGQPSALR